MQKGVTKKVLPAGWLVYWSWRLKSHWHHISTGILLILYWYHLCTEIFSWHSTDITHVLASCWHKLSTALHYTALKYSALRYTALHCTALHCNQCNSLLRISWRGLYRWCWDQQNTVKGITRYSYSAYCCAVQCRAVALVKYGAVMWTFHPRFPTCSAVWSHQSGSICLQVYWRLHLQEDKQIASDNLKKSNWDHRVYVLDTGGLYCIVLYCVLNTLVKKKSCLPRS